MHSRYIVIGFISWIGTTLFLKSQLNHRTYSCAKIIRNPFFGLSWLENHTWLGECLTILSLTHRKNHVQKKKKKYSERMVKRYLKKKMHSHIQAEYKMVFHIYRNRCKFSSIFILCISISDEHWVIISVYKPTYSWSFWSLRIWEITSLLPSSRGTRLCTNTLTSLVHYH